MDDVVFEWDETHPGDQDPRNDCSNIGSRPAEPGRCDVDGTCAGGTAGPIPCDPSNPGETGHATCVAGGGVCEADACVTGVAMGQPGGCTSGSCVSLLGQCATIAARSGRERL